MAHSYPLSLVLTAVDRITGPLRQINQRLLQLKTPFREVSNAASSLGHEAGMPQLAERFGRVRTAVGGLNSALYTTGRRMAIVTAAGTGLAFLFQREFIGTADTFERLEMSLEAIEGSADKARTSMAFLKKMTVETPFEMEDIAKAFRVMRGFGMDPMGGALQVIVDQAAKLGGTGEDLTGIAMQLGQAWSKGRLMAQDANILVERGVPVWGLLQRAVERVNKGQKISIGDLRKLSEEGKLGTKAVTLLIEQMGIESAGASSRMMKSWSGMMSNLRDNWTFFKLAVMDSGPFRVLKGELQGVLDTIARMAANGELQRWAERIGQKLLDAFNWLRTEGPAIWSQVSGGLEKIFRVAESLATVFGGWGNLITVGLAAYIAGPLVAAVVALTLALSKLGIAAAGVGARLGWAGLGAAGAAGAAGAGAGSKVIRGMSVSGAVATGAAAAGTVAKSGMLGRLLGPLGLAMLVGDLLGEVLPEPKRVWIKQPNGMAPPLSLPTRTGTAGPAAVDRDLNAKLEVIFKNAPAGTRVYPDPRSTLPMSLNTGIHLPEAR